MKYLELFEEFNFDIESSNAYGNSLDVVINDEDFTFNINNDDVSFASNDDYKRAFEIGIEIDDELRTYIIDEYNKMIGKTKMKRFGFFKETLSIFKNDNKKQELIDFCNNNLAYLIDEGYSIVVKELHSGIYPFTRVYYNICITCSDSEIDGQKSLFYWKTIKDDFIPFFELLDNNYKTKSTLFYKVDNPSDYENEDFMKVNDEFLTYSKEQILSDKIYESTIFYRIEINIK